MRRGLIVVVAGACVALGSCFAVTDFDDLETTRRETFVLPYDTDGNVEGVDILFVVDNLPLVQDWELDGNGDLYGFGDLEILGVGDPQGPGGHATGPVHVGVVTSNLGSGGYDLLGCEGDGDDGRLVTEVSDGCPSIDGSYIELIGGAITNIPDAPAGFTLTEAVNCLVNAQTQRQGCAFPQPLEAATRALDHPENLGFARTGANLAVVFVSNADDCSASDPSVFNPDPTAESVLGPLNPFRCFEFGVSCDVNDRYTPGARSGCTDRTDGGELLYKLDTVYNQLVFGRNPENVIVSTIAGPADQVRVRVELDIPALEPICTGSGWDGFPGVRLDSFRKRFGDNGMGDSVCDPDIGSLLFQIRDRLEARAAYRCVPTPLADLDEDPSNGIQADCLVHDVVELNTTSEQRFGPYPSCDTAGEERPCYRALTESVCTSGHKIEVIRYEPAPVGSEMLASCLVMLP